MACKQCGMCCITANIQTNWSMTNNLDFAKWLTMHGCRAYVNADGPQEGLLGIIMPNICMYLEIDWNTRTTFCSIHDKPERPDMCKEYFCDKAKDG